MYKKRSLSKVVLKCLASVLLAGVLFFAGYMIISSLSISRYNSYLEDHQEELEETPLEYINFFLSASTFQATSTHYESVIEKEPFKVISINNDLGESITFEFYNVLIYNQKETYYVSLILYKDINAVVNGTLESNPLISLKVTYNVPPKEDKPETITSEMSLETKSDYFQGMFFSLFERDTFFKTGYSTPFLNIDIIEIKLLQDTSNANFISLATSENKFITSHFPGVNKEDRLLNFHLFDSTIKDILPQDFDPKTLDDSIFFYKFIDVSPYKGSLILGYSIYIPIAIAIFYWFILHSEIKRILYYKKIGYIPDDSLPPETDSTKLSEKPDEYKIDPKDL